MLWILLSLFGGAAVAPALYRVTRHFTAWLAALLPLSVLAWSAQYWTSISAGGYYRESYRWAPSLGVNAAFLLDGLSLVFLLLISGIGALVLVYAGQYMREDRRLGLFYAYLLLFMGAMLGLVLADNVFLLFVFWELTSISSFLLIGWNHASADSREAARTALVITAGGGMMLLAGMVLLAQIGQTSELSQMPGDAVRGSPLYLLTLGLVLGGAFTKSAQFPFHFWLPGAMAAPTPVSAYLHSATMVKAGVYLLARLHPTMGTTDAWIVAVTVVGGLTMLVGAVLAVKQADLKLILAYSTVSILGALTMLLGIGTHEAIWAAMAYLVAHSLYKGALFLIAGSVDHETGTRDITHLRGLFRPMPVSAVAAVLAAASMAGLPPLFGFIAKELLYEASWQAPGAGPIVTVVSVFASVLMVTVALMVAYRPFFGVRVQTPQSPHEAPWQMGLGPVTLSAVALLIGLNPGLVSAPLNAAAAAVIGEQVELKLSLWHGFNAILALSAATIAAGVAAYFVLTRWDITAALGKHDKLWTFQGIYDRAFSATMRSAEVLTQTVQNGYLRNYVLIVVLTLLALLAGPIAAGRSLFMTAMSEMHAPEVILAGVVLAAALATTLINSRLGVAAVLGAIGIAVMMLYVIFGALDLAVTQIMVETLTVILLVLVLYHLPRFVSHSSKWVYLRDGLVSLVFGGMFAMLVIKAFGVQAAPELREYFVTSSYTEAYGRNVTNVILVDFRAADTMGEVTVLMVAAVGVFALLRFPTGRRERGVGMVSLVLCTATPVLMLLLLVVSLYALLRGHHDSGGGFIGGLLAAAAFALHALAFDVRSTRRLMRIAPQPLMGLGLAVIAVSGAAGLALGASFLQGQWVHLFLPGIGQVHVGTPLLFDIGVYAVVMGMVLTIILTAAEE